MSRTFQLERDLGALLREKRLLLATAESCTGGMLGQRLTAVAGSSDYYAGGVIAYANTAKVALLGVPEALLAEHGAVSAPVAKAMSVGALARFGAGVAISTTGIAGPSGGTPDKPVGLVFIGIAMEDRQPAAYAFQFEGNRDAVRMAAGQTALEMVQCLLVSDKA